MSSIQKFLTFLKKYFGIIIKTALDQFTFQTKFAQNKIVYLRQHFEETVKPGIN